MGIDYRAHMAPLLRCDGPCGGVRYLPRTLDEQKFKAAITKSPFIEMTDGKHYCSDCANKMMPVWAGFDAGRDETMAEWHEGRNADQERRWAEASTCTHSCGCPCHEYGPLCGACIKAMGTT